MKKKLTTLLTLALVAVFALALVACDDDSGSAIPTPPTSEKGNTYTQSKFVVEWGSDEDKKHVLDEMEVTEEQLKQMYNGLNTTIVFSDDDRVSANAPYYPSEGGSGFSSGSLFYSIAEDGSITFYSDKGKKSALNEGFFSYTFVISKDYTKISMSGTLSAASKCEIVLTIV